MIIWGNWLNTYNHLPHIDSNKAISDAFSTEGSADFTAVDSISTTDSELDGKSTDCT